MPRRVSYKIEGPSGSQIEKAVTSAVEVGLERLRDEVELRWMRHARTKLDTTAQQYLEGLEVVKVDDGVEATISGWLPVALEEGVQPFDMKPGLLKGRQSRVIPMHDGEFRTVSQRSPKGSWWHPGFQPRAIHEDVEAEADSIVQRAFGPAFDRIKV